MKRKGKFKMKKWISFILVFTMLLMLVTACGQQTPAPTTAAPTTAPTEAPTEAETTTFGLTPFTEKQTLRVGFFTGSPLSYPFLFADKLGYFEELNIELVYEPFTNGPAMMESNAAWDIASCGLGGLANGMRGYDVRVISITDYEENLALFARPGTPLAEDPKNPENWKGTEWIYPAGTTAQATLVNALEEVGLSLQDVTSINMDVANALTGYKGGTGDGLGVWNVIAFAAEDAGFVRIGDAGSLGFVAPCGTVTKESVLNEKMDLVATAVAVFHFTVEWIYESDANMEQATEWFLEDCENEGILVTPDIAVRVMDWYRGPTMSEYLEIFTKESPDTAGIYTKRNLIQAEKDILVGLDFFISQGNYKPEDRERFLDEGLIDPSVALKVKQMLDDLGIDY
jgi:ABC-type nitrate/sulfonate/bicarbonate transport system substrate-binding protein